MTERELRGDVIQHESAKPGHTREQKRFYLMDGLRGLAAMLVVTFHVMSMRPNPLPPPFPNAFLAVDFFFVLSGFVIAYTYDDRLQGGLSFRDFFVSRVIRLYPLILLGLIAGIVHVDIQSHSLTAGTSLRYFLTSLAGEMFLIPISILGDHMLFDYPIWSLSLEFITYLVFATLVRKRWAGNKTLVALVLVSLYILSTGAHGHSMMNVGFHVHENLLALARVGFSFGFGVLLFRGYRAYGNRVMRGIGGICFGLVGVGTLLFALANSNPLITTFRPQLLIVALVLPFVVFVSAFVEVPLSLGALCTFLGDMSYPMYLLHEPLLAPVLNNTALHRGGLFYLTVMSVMSWFVFRYVDTPVRRWLSTTYKQWADAEASRSTRMYG
jgi:peptidoglycan/LPS O-acetylase OafA/YrhL